MLVYTATEVKIRFILISSTLSPATVEFQPCSTYLIENRMNPNFRRLIRANFQFFLISFFDNMSCQICFAKKIVTCP